MSDKLIEILARGIWASEYDEQFDSLHPRSVRRALAVQQATAALTAIREAGWAVVPVEPTEAMLDASWKQTGESKEMRPRTHHHYARHYRAMLNAITQEECENKRSPGNLASTPEGDRQ
jgi:hypothetical protein